MRLNKLGFLIVSLLAFMLAACTPSSIITVDQVATNVAATLQANGQPVPTEAPTLGEVATQAPSEPACANASQVSVAYLKDGDVWLWLPGGVRSQLTTSGDAQSLAISQDGCRIAYSRSVPNPLFDASVEFPTAETLNELWAVNSDGTSNRALADTAFFASQPVAQPNYILSAFRFAFRPGSHDLAFNTQVLHPGVGLTVNNDLFIANVDAATITTLLGAEQAGGSFAFSPDGEQVAFSTSTAVHVINVDGSNLRRDLISFPPVITYSEYLYTPPLHWTPDSSSLMVAVPPADAMAGGLPETALFWIPLDGTPPFAAGSVQAAFFILGEVAFSPDASRIAYLRPLGEMTSSEHELVVALSNGSDELPAISGDQIDFLAWSTDNNRFLYATRAGSLQLWVGSVSDGSSAPLTPLDGFSAFAAEAVWVDPTRLALLELGEGGNARLSLLNISGGGELIDSFASPFVSFALSH